VGFLPKGHASLVETDKGEAARINLYRDDLRDQKAGEYENTSTPTSPPKLR